MLTKLLNPYASRTPRIVALAAAAVVAGTVGAVTTTTANADIDTPANSYSWGEFMGYTDAGMSRGNLQGQWGCDCHGYIDRQWYGRDGHRRFQVVYPGTIPENSVFITYRFDGFGTPRVWTRMFATDGEGYVVPFGG